MKIKKQQSGLTLIELLVVIGIIAAVVAISLPAINAMQKSFDSTGAEGMINAALSTARTLAISKRQYVGVRFQKEYSDKSILETDQYMIFVINDMAMSNVGDAFRTIEGYKPMKLPANVSILDMMIRGNTADTNEAAECRYANENDLKKDDLDNSILERTITDTSAFSVVFSPAGKLVIHDIRIRNIHGKFRPPDLVITGSNPKGSTDTVFNSVVNITDNHTGQFVQDDYANLGLGGETSRNKLVIYNREEFKKLTDKTQRWDYLNDNAKSVYINPYTGGIIDK